MKKIDKEIIFVTFDDLYPNVQTKLETKKITINEIELCDIIHKELQDNKDDIIILEISHKQKLLSNTSESDFIIC